MGKGKRKREKQRAKQQAQHETAQVRGFEEVEISDKGATKRAAEGANEYKPIKAPIWKEFMGWIREKSSFTDWCLVLFTGMLAGASIYQFHIMSGQLTETSQEFALSHRPWVDISNGVHADGPLVFDESSAHITVSYILRNGGTAPSIGTFTIGPGLMLSDEQTPLTLPDFRRVINCDKVTATPPPGFPGTIDKASNEIGTLILPGDTNEVRNYTLKTQGTIPTSSTGRWNIWFPLCIHYKDDVGNFHGTGLLYQFQSSTGELVISPVGSINGSFQQIGVGNEAY